MGDRTSDGRLAPAPPKLCFPELASQSLWLRSCDYRKRQRSRDVASHAADTKSAVCEAADCHSTGRWSRCRHHVASYTDSLPGQRSWRSGLARFEHLAEEIQSLGE